MKNRTLKRPMFRKGGPAMEGIMTGIQDRTNYQEGGRATELAEEYAKLLRRMAPSPTDRSLPQFLIQGGLNLVSGKGATGNTLRDVASAYQQPTAGLFKGIQARDAYDAQIGMAAAKAGISGAQSEREAALKARANSSLQKDYSPQRAFEELLKENLKSAGKLQTFQKPNLEQKYPRATAEYDIYVTRNLRATNDPTGKVIASNSKGFVPFDAKTQTFNYNAMQPGSFYYDPRQRSFVQRIPSQDGGKSEIFLYDKDTFKKSKL